MKITIEGNTVDGSARSTLNVVLSGARGPAGEQGDPGQGGEWGTIVGDITEQTDLYNALQEKVPYTGATQDVNLGEFGLLTGNLEFDTTPTNAPTGAGSMSWNDTDGTVNLVLKGGNVVSRIGETQHVRVYNNTGTAIARGKVVYVSGAQGQRLTVALADADTEILSKDTIGFTAESIADGAEGFVLIAGVLSNINTNGMADGATVFLSQTAGGYTTTPPVDPAHLVILGFIVNGGSGGAGSIYVKVDNGYELEELHNVSDSAKTTPVGADALLLRDSENNNLWKRLTWTNALAGVKTHMDTFKGVAGGYASLDGSGKIPSSELPSYVDDVIEAASFAALPVTGETGKIYVTLDTNKVYRWTGSVYVEVSPGGASAWGAITGTLSNQTDLQSALDAKQDDIILTTTGTSGAATLVGSTLNIPQYQSVLTNPVTGTGTSGQVAYWSGTTTQTGSNNLFWDNANGRLGVGTNAPTGRIHALYSNFSDVAVLERTPSFNTDLAASAILRAGYTSSPSNGGGPSFSFQNRVSSTLYNLASFGAARDGTDNNGLLRYGTFREGSQRYNMTIFSTGNILLETNTTSSTFTDNGQRLQVIGSTLLRGSGTTSATTALLVQNSTPTANFTIRDDGGYAFRGGTVGVAQTGYTTFTNLTTDRTCDANATTVEELADILGTLIEDLKTKGIISA